MPKDLIIFKDFYTYYNAIKYEFVYGLPYDKEIAKCLFDDELQSKKLTTSILESIKYKIDQIPYYYLLESKERGRRFKFSLVNKNRYNFFADNWFDYVYSSYGYLVTEKEEKREHSNEIKKELEYLYECTRSEEGLHFKEEKEEIESKRDLYRKINLLYEYKKEKCKENGRANSFIEMEEYRKKVNKKIESLYYISWNVKEDVICKKIEILYNYIGNGSKSKEEQEWVIKNFSKIEQEIDSLYEYIKEADRKYFLDTKERRKEKILKVFLEYMNYFIYEKENFGSEKFSSDTGKFLMHHKLLERLSGEKKSELKNKLYNNREVYDMIEFFSKFSFLGSIGASLNRKLNLDEYGGIPIFIRGVSGLYGMAQESIYRCLFAIWNKREITIQLLEKEKENEQERRKKIIKGIPIRVFYKGYTLHEKKAYPYVEIFRTDVSNMEMKENSKSNVYPYILSNQQFECYSLYEGHGIKLGTKLGTCTPIADRTDKKVHRISAEFYYNDIKNNGEITDYILNRLKSHLWDNELNNNIESLEETKTKKMESIYYPLNSVWKIKKCAYLIAEEDYNIFLNWIDSFGEFAKIINSEEILTKKEESWGEDICIGTVKSSDKRNEIEYSLFNPYNSDILKQMVKYYNSLVKDRSKKVILYPLPQEIFWLHSILKNFPNLCSIFFENMSCKNEIEKIVEEDRDKFKDIFNPFEIDKKLLQHNCIDIKKDSVKKYSAIWRKIKKQQLIEYKYVDKEEKNKEELKRVYLYALEYNVVAANASRKNDPFLIMAYDMNQKRIVNLELKAINMNNEKNSEEDNITLFDKLYCIIAFYIRVNYVITEFKNRNIYIGMKDKSNFEKEMNKEKAEKKKCEIFGRMKLKILLENLEDLYTSNSQDVSLDNINYKDNLHYFKGKDLEENMKDAFQFYHAYLNKSEDVKSNYDIDRERHGVTICGNDEIRYKRDILSIFFSLFNNCSIEKRDNIINSAKEIDNSVIKEILLGNPYQFLFISESDKLNLEIEGSKLNEIVYLNERMKTTNFTFVLKKEKINVENLDRIYDAFREFNCIGKKIDADDGFALKFTIFYERFNYRKIHMGILALGKLIENIQPQELERLIKARKENIYER